jgi:hypothetical protein
MALMLGDWVVSSCQISAIAIGQYNIGKEQLQMVRVAVEGEEGFGGSSRFQYAISGQVQDLAGYLTNESFILHEEDGRGQTQDGEWGEQHGAGSPDDAFLVGLMQPRLTQISLTQR